MNGRVLLNNSLLAALPSAGQKRLQPHLQHVSLLPGTVLHEIGERTRHAYLPLSGLVSLLSGHDDETVGLTLVGLEGLIGLWPVLGLAETCRAVVIAHSDGYRIPVRVLASEYHRDGSVRDLLVQYSSGLMTEFSQACLCVTFHTVQQRLCRWLLAAQDRGKLDTIDVSQAVLREWLGASRREVALAACALHDQRLIRRDGGGIHVLDRVGLEAHACECYSVCRLQKLV